MSHKRILFFGDSLTWGWVPTEEGKPSTRYPLEQRWTGIVASLLGEQIEIIEEGLSSRTTDLDDPIDPRLNGSRYLPSALASHLPLDLAVIMLGTNDTKGFYHRTPHEIATGMQKLVIQVLGSAGGVGTGYPAPQVLIVSPPPLGTIDQAWFGHMFKGGKEKTEQLAEQYATLARVMNIHFLDAGQATQTDGIDGIHFTPENNKALGEALAARIRQILEL